MAMRKAEAQETQSRSDAARAVDKAKQQASQQVAAAQSTVRNADDEVQQAKQQASEQVAQAMQKAQAQERAVQQAKQQSSQQVDQAMQKIEAEEAQSRSDAARAVQQAEQQASQKVAQAEKEAQTAEAKVGLEIHRQALQKAANQKEMVVLTSCFAVFLLGLVVMQLIKRKNAPASNGMEYNSNLQSLEKGLLDGKNQNNRNIKSSSGSLKSFSGTLERTSKPVEVVKSDKLFSWDVSELCRSQSFEMGEGIVGDTFMVGGVPDLCLKLYPAGDFGAPEGSCTLFLEIPCGWQIAARIFIGDCSGVSQGEMPEAPGATWGLRGDAPKPSEFNTVGVELLSAIDLRDQIRGA